MGELERNEARGTQIRYRPLVVVAVFGHGIGQPVAINRAGPGDNEFRLARDIEQQPQRVQFQRRFE